MNNYIWKDLQKFGDKIDDYTIFNSKYRDNGNPMQKTFDNQREIYGFDNREIYNLDITTIGWLYTHIVRLRTMMKKHGIEKPQQFTIKIPVRSSYKKTFIPDIYETITIDFNTCVDLILEYFEFFITYNKDFENENHDIIYDIAKYGINIYAELLPCLWY